MKILSIVSTFNESCGNAYFSKILQESIQDESLKVDCQELDLSLTRSVNLKARWYANKHIKNMAKKIATYDGVNIQLEPFLYGSNRKDIVKRVKILTGANPNVSVTFHSPRLNYSKNFYLRTFLLKIFKLNIIQAFKDLLVSFKMNEIIDINHDIIKHLSKKNIPIIVHTQRAKKQILNLYNYKNVFVHPLQMVDQTIKSDNQLLDKLKYEFSCSENDVIIGMFGYINEYKGHTIALQAMKLLPSNYKLFIFGRQHPQTIKQNEFCSKYLEELQFIIQNTKELKNRVFFVGEVETTDFINLASQVDVVWLPYVENGQDGSGIASICFDVSKRIICSSSFAFDELLKLINYKNYYRFDIGNYVQMAQKTLQIMKADINKDPVPDRKFSLNTQAQLYKSFVRN